MTPHTIETLRLLVVSSEVSVLRLLGSTAQSNSWHVETSASGWDAMERVQSGVAPHLLLVDIHPGDGEGLHLLLWLRRLRPDLPIAVMCDPDDKSSQKEATRMGANHVLLRPVIKEQIESLVRKTLGSSDDDKDADMASENIEALGEDEFFLSVSPITQKVRTQAELLAQTDVPVLILGEPGSGKGTIARLIHKLSVHAGFKFLRVNCSEMPGDLLEIELFGRRNGSNGSASGRTGLGKLEIGENGTLLLDEITAMPLSLQTRLLQVLQNKRFSRPGDDRPVEVGVRILAASSDKVDRALAEKRLHDGLYYRLSAFTIHVPPLRQRKDEIKALVRYSMHKLARYYGLPPRDFSSSVLEACFNHSWPGNLEELETFVKRYLVAGDKEFPVSGSESGFGSNGDANGRTVGISANPPVPDGSRMTVAKSLKALIQGIKCETERNAIAAALGKTGWNRKAAARLMGVSYRTMLYKIDQYHMSAPETFISPFLRSPVPITPKEMEK